MASTSIFTPAKNFSFTRTLVVPLCLVLLYGGYHLVTLLTAIETVQFSEELYRGVIAKEIVQGLKAPLWDYQADYYSGGSLAVAWVVSFFFRHVGESLFVLKLTPLLFSTATLVLLYFFAKRFLGFQVAWMASLLFTFPPPSLTYLTHLAMGFHSESLLFSLLSLYFFYAYFFPKTGRPRENLFLVFSGVVSGFGFWFVNITGLTTLSLLLCGGLIQGKSFWRREFFIFLTAFFVGLLPYLLYNIFCGGESALFLLRAFAPDDFTPRFILSKFLRIVRRAIDFPLISLPASFHFFPYSKGLSWVGAYVYYGIIVYLVRGMYRGGTLQGSPEKKRYVFFYVFPVVFWLLGTASNFIGSFPIYGHYLDSRYFVPLYFFGIIFAASGVHLLKKRFCFIILLLFGILGSSQFLFKDPVGIGLKFKGYSYAQLGMLWSETLFRYFDTRDSLKYHQIVNRLSPQDRFFFEHGLFNSLCGREEMGERDLFKLLDIATPSYRPYYLECLAREKGEKIKKFLSEGFTENEMKFFENGLAFYAAEGSNLSDIQRALRDSGNIASIPAYLFHRGNLLAAPCVETRCDQAIQQVISLEEKQKQWVFRGMGYVYSSFLFEGWPPQGFQQERFKDFPEAAYPDLAWGVGARVFDIHFEDPTRGQYWISALPSGMRLTAQEGFKYKKERHRVPGS